MALTPNDIRNCEFSVQMRGYQKEEVDDFLEHIAVSVEAEKEACLKLTLEIDSIRTQFQALKEHENAIKDAAIDARRNADKTISEAKAEADEIMGQAEAESKRLIGSKEAQLRQIEERIIRAREIQDSYLVKLRELIENHLEMADKMSEAHTQSQATQDAIEITDSSEVSRNGMETLATQPEPAEPIDEEEDRSSDTMVGVAVAAAVTPEPELVDGDSPESESAVDPELSAALQSYQSSLNKSPDAADEIETAPPPPIGQIVETTALASDVPDGFISEDQHIDDEATGKFQAQGRQAVIQDLPHSGPDESDAVDAEVLADELDKVVAKFEEEMDKAESK